MSNGSSYNFLSISELSRQVSKKVLSPVEIMKDCIARIEAVNPRLNAFTHCFFEEALREARNAEQAIFSGGAVGPLHGLPNAMKDFNSRKPDWPLTFGGIKALADYKAETSSVYVERMGAAGSIFVGKTNSSVMGYRGTTDNPMFGATGNPFDPDRNSGGSSGGSAAAVAAGMLPLAEATDGGGSIRIPAAWCNLFGYKAAFGRVPKPVRPNGFGGTNPFYFTGAMTRTVEDAALAMTVLAGYDSRDPYSLSENVDYRSALNMPIQGMRIAYSPDFGVYPVEEEIADMVAKAVARFEEAGARVDVIDFEMPLDLCQLTNLWHALVSTSNVEIMDALAAEGYDLMRSHSADLPDELIANVEFGRKLSASDIRTNQVMQTLVYDAIRSIFQTFDLLVTPTLACSPVANQPGGATKGPETINGIAVDPSIGWCLTFPLNLTGNPAASVPVGLTKAGLPVGMQLIGPRYGDLAVLSASANFERIQPWLSNFSGLIL